MGAEMLSVWRSVPLACAAALMLASCAATPVSTGSVPPPQFGWLHGNCIAVSAPLASLPQPVLLSRDAPDSGFAEAQIVAPADTNSACNALLTDRAQTNLANGNVFYIVEASEPVELAIGILSSGNEETLKYDYCFTSEGVRFSVSSGQRVIWQEYYYLGYDVEPDCS